MVRQEAEQLQTALEEARREAAAAQEEVAVKHTALCDAQASARNGLEALEGEKAVALQAARDREEEAVASAAEQVQVVERKLKAEQQRGQAQSEEVIELKEAMEQAEERVWDLQEQLEDLGTNMAEQLQEQAEQAVDHQAAVQREHQAAMEEQEAKLKVLTEQLQAATKACAQQSAELQQSQQSFAIRELEYATLMEAYDTLTARNAQRADELAKVRDNSLARDEDSGRLRRELDAASLKAEGLSENVKRLEKQAVDLRDQRRLAELQGAKDVGYWMQEHKESAAEKEIVEGQLESMRVRHEEQARHSAALEMRIKQLESAVGAAEASERTYEEQASEAGEKASFLEGQLKAQSNALAAERARVEELQADLEHVRVDKQAYRNHAKALKADNDELQQACAELGQKVFAMNLAHLEEQGQSKLARKRVK